MSVASSITACVHTINVPAVRAPSPQARAVGEWRERRSVSILSETTELATTRPARCDRTRQAANTSRQRQTEETDACGVHGRCRLSTETASIHNVGRALNVAGIATACSTKRDSAAVGSDLRTRRSLHCVQRAIFSIKATSQSQSSGYVVVLVVGASQTSGTYKHTRTRPSLSVLLSHFAAAAAAADAAVALCHPLAVGVHQSPRSLLTERLRSLAAGCAVVLAVARVGGSNSYSAKRLKAP